MNEQDAGYDSLIDPDAHAHDIATLVRAIEQGVGSFSLIVVHCNFGVLRQYLIKEILRLTKCRTAPIRLDRRATVLLGEVRKGLEEDRFDAVLVDGLDESGAKQSIIRSTNDDRERFGSDLPVPMVLFVAQPTAQLFEAQGAHFLSVKALERSIGFTDAEMLTAIDQTAGALCNTLVTKGAGVHPRSLEQQLAPIASAEVSLAAEELQRRGLDHKIRSRAQIELLQGLVGGNGAGTNPCCHLRPIRCHYSKSVNLCRGKASIELVAASYLLGLWYMQYGMLYTQCRRQAFPLAARYYGICLGAISELDGDKGRGRFINAEADALRRQVQRDLVEPGRRSGRTRQEEERRKKIFERLRSLADEAAQLHQAAGDTRRLARAKAYCALVALDLDQDADRAWDLAQEALELQKDWMRQEADDHERVDWERKYHRGFYYLVLAGAEVARGELEPAIQHLRKAKDTSALTYDPQLYGEILDAVVNAHRKQGEHALAFSAAMELRDLRQRYRKAVFAGLSSSERLAPLTNPVFQDIQLDQSSWQFGRDETIDKIVKAVRDHEFKHIILYGPRGVGKSSLLRAGVLPRFESERIDDKPVKLCMLDLLSNWQQQICDWLRGDCAQHSGTETRTGSDADDDCLRALDTADCFCILVLDDVDEFVMSHKRRDQRRPFWQFLAKFSTRTSTKVILTFDQDFLYTLAEFLEAISEQTKRWSYFDIKSLHRIGRLDPKEVRRSVLVFSPQLHLIEQEVVEQMFDHVQDEEGGIQPLLLQIVGAQLEEIARDQGRAVTQQDWKDLDKGAGQKEHLIHSFLREIFHEFKNNELENTAMRCAYLLSSGSNVWERTWISAAEVYDEISRTEEGMTPDQVEQSLDMLVDARLLKRRSWPDRTARYRYAHESLVRNLRTFAETEYWEQVRRLTVSQDVIVVERHNAAASDHFLRHDHLAALVEIMRSQRLCTDNAKIPAKLVSDTADRLQTILYGTDEINRLDKHRADVNSLSFSRDGSTLVSGSDDDTVIVWDRSGHVRIKIDIKGRWVTSVKINPADTHVAAGCTDGTVKLWTLDGEHVRTFGRPTKTWVFGVKFLPDGTGIVAAYQDEPIKIWDVATGNLRKEIQHGGGRTLCVDVSPDGQHIASGSDDHSVRIWDLDGAQLNEVEDAGAEVHAVRFSHSGSFLSYTNGKTDFALWHLESGNRRRIQGHTRAVNSLAFNADDSLIATGSNDNTVRLWRVDDGSLIKTYQGHTTWVRYVVFDPRGEFVASAGEDHSIRFWRTSYPLPQNLSLEGREIHAVSFCGSNRLTTGGWDKRVRMNNLDTGEVIWEEPHSDWVWDVAVSPDWSLVAASGGEKTIRLHASKTGETVATLEGHGDCVHSMNFSPDGTRLASASGDGTVRIWRLKGGEWLEEQEHRYDGHEDQVWGVCFHPSGRLLASGGSDQKVHIWSLDGRISLRLSGHTHWINCLAFHPNVDELATASNDGTIRIWQRDGGTWVDKSLIAGHSGKVFSVEYDPGGNFLASAGVDGLIKIWSRDGRLWRNLEGHTGAVNALSVHPDGKRVASAGDDQQVKIWPIEPVPTAPPSADALMAQAQSLISDYLENHQIRV